MLTFRPFRNADPPLLAALWRSRADRPCLQQPVTPELLEQLVFAKLYFDYEGLIVARDDARPVGFAHAGFGPNEQLDWISPDAGVTCLILTASDCDEEAVAGGLLDRCEEYLKHRGAKSLFGGGVNPMNPFYVGLFGGGDLPGVLDSDAFARGAFESRGYRQVERIILMRRDLVGLEPGVDRRQLKIRREMAVEVVPDAHSTSWWEACVFGEFELTRFHLKSRFGGPAVATATFRGTAPGGTAPGDTAAPGRSVALIDIAVNTEHRRGGLARFLLHDAFRWLMREGVLSVELQAFESDAAALAVFANLGFRQVEQGGLWRKDV